MITTIILYVFGFILNLVSGFSNIIARGVSVWPSSLLDGLTYFFTSLMGLDFFLNIVQMLAAIKWLVGFLVIYVSVRLSLKIINWVRGSGELDV